MAPQRKTSREKKQADPINWTKVGAISIAVLFAVMMVASLLGTAWIGGMRTVQPGDLVVIDYTIYNENDIPVLTTQEIVASQEEQAGRFVYLSGPIEVSAGYSPDDDMISIPHRYGTIAPFGLFRSEFETISESAIGYRERDQITVPFTIENPDSPFEREMTAEQITEMGYPFDELSVGDMIILGFADNPQITLDDVEPDIKLRFAFIKEKTDETVLVRYGYSYAVVTINSVTAIS
ncbi:MAG: hypothetical protein XE11_0260 [Methanomicrobiales archaeon 53_19]|jgi:hypothetical protein|uniref:hypothetical protein n=1 Tax=Methanocalculus sp. TaxID=2004547 RepID=UPI0007480CB0|nr:hypothetical protein [Methanocalculus sp.]KUK69748.1 MAG: hypothetical protein XD88_1071 [Methanocalculus sp. 52_23]KUL04825.1 MAG: hypothetical protein XE11_0260 [Methanomicrobiales archaeon 53_19]HIJ06072.1 hypothetical protein [Methanocalculus sp.]